MAKKVRRVRRVSKNQDSGSGGVRLTTEERFAEEYAYVLKDLRRVFIIAAAMFVLLIGLNLLLQ